MNNMVNAFFNDILQEVMLIENCKKDISSEILAEKNFNKQLKCILKFILRDLDKHLLFEQAAVVAINNNHEEIINRIKKFYSHTEPIDILDTIRAELKYINRFISVLQKEIKMPENTTFVEKRMVREINKYIVSQTKIYNQMEK